MSVNTNIIISDNSFSGFKNYTTASFSAVFTTQAILIGKFVGPIRATTPLNNANSVTQVQIQYSGLDAFTRILPGVIIHNVPTSNSPSYQIESFSYFTGGNLIVDSYVINESAGTITPPTITFNCRAFLFLAPF